MEKKELKKLQQLSKEEKIEVAQMLWDDIARNQNQVEIPEEHKRILDHRLNKIKQGKGNFKSWDEISKKYKAK